MPVEIWQAEHLQRISVCHKESQCEPANDSLLLRLGEALLSGIYPSYFKLHVRWLRSITRITY
ncbi:hypothetical protein CBW57_03040 [Yersinia intermedia]|uniref:Uncharacterized protein n=1 Tax=Yersinia intermedia TaxID=631 RepID=A0A209AA19_YERIN|nr:hypothetical protein CBW57_03040 [Yersinia intermedia]